MGLFGFLNFVQGVCPCMKGGQGVSNDGQGASNDGQGNSNDSQGSPTQQSHVQSQRGRYQPPGPRRTMYLIVYNSEVDPAHWSILVPQQNSQTVGTMIHVVSSPNGGFQHQIRATTNNVREADTKNSRLESLMNTISQDLSRLR